MTWLMLIVVLIALNVLWRFLRKRWRRALTQSEAVLVTGCDSGFGFTIVKELLEQTEVMIFAGYITEDGRKSLAKLGSRVTPLQLDVTSNEEAQDAFAAIAKSGVALRGVVNNAALGCYGHCELLSLERFEKNIQVNYLGAIRITKLALPMIRANKGRFVFVSSLGAHFPSAFGSAYVPTKAGMNHFQDCLRQEMYRFGVKCSAVTPGFFATGLLHRAATLGESSSAKPKNETEDLSEVYEPYAEKMKRTEGSVRMSEKLNGGEHGCTYVADAVIDALSTIFPKAYYICGVDANILVRVAPFLPCWVVDLLQTYII